MATQLQFPGVLPNKAQREAIRVYEFDVMERKIRRERLCDVVYLVLTRVSLQASNIGQALRKIKSTPEYTSCKFVRRFFIH